MNYFAATTRKKLVSIIMLVHNQIEYTRQCLDSVFKYSGEPFELIIVDNNSTDGTPEYLSRVRNGMVDVGGWRLRTGECDRIEWHSRTTDQVCLNEKTLGVKWPWGEGERPENEELSCRGFKVIRNEENLGFAAGNNQGIAEAAGDYLLLMNNDIVVTPGWLGRMIDCIEQEPQIGIVGPMSNHVSGPQLAGEISYDTRSLEGLNRFAQQHARKHQGQAQPFWRVVGFCMLIKREVVDKIGGLDGRYGLGNFEDDDFSLRSALAGFESRIVCDSFVHHFGSRTFLGSGMDYNESLRKNWEIFKKRWGIPLDVPYGAPYDRMDGIDKGFIPAEHYCPIVPGECSERNGNHRGSSALCGKAKGGELEASGKPHNSGNSFDVAEFLNAQGELQFGGGKPDHARVCFEMAIERNPNHPRAHSNLGVVLWQRGELEKALESLHRALELDPEDSDILYNSSKALMDAGELDVAADLLKFYLQRNPRHEVVWEEYSSLVHQMGTLGWKPEGVSTQAAEVYATMGKELIDAKDYAGAGESLHRALLLNPQQVEAYFQLGRLHLALGQGDEAVGLMKEVLRLDPCHKECERTLNEALSSQQLFREAATLSQRDSPDAGYFPSSRI